MVSFGGLLQAAIFFGPYLVPRALAFYRSIRSTSQGPNSAVRPPPPRVQRCLSILFGAVIISLALSLPYFSPPNVFKETQSRLGLLSNLLVSRLTALRGGDLTELDQIFIQKLETEPEKKFKLLYAAYGPDVALKCPYCQAIEPQDYLYYALPGIAIPHLVHIFLLGAVTSSFFSGPEGSRWRKYVTIAGVSLALWELYTTWNYNWEANGSKHLLSEVDFFYWRMRSWRHLSFALIDAIFGWMLWLTSTNRWLVKPPDLVEQLVGSIQTASQTHAHVNLLANLRNTQVRDNELRGIEDAYWRQEGQEMAAIMEDPDVRAAVNVVLAREDYDKTKRRAQLYINQILDQTLQPPTTDVSSKKRN